MWQQQTAQLHAFDMVLDGSDFNRSGNCQSVSPVGGVTCTAAASMPVGFMYWPTRYSSMVTTLSRPPSFQYAASPEAEYE